ncbi:MAG: TonB family protein [Gemmatimonadaceae bacterium]|nr:TonB family protein [Gemmatimonadaceae bacterium]
MTPIMTLLIPLGSSGCSERTRAVRASSEGWFRAEAPDERPQMLNEYLPFRYPVALYRQRIEGNVTLRLFVDSLGQVVRDSTRVAESSGHAAFDSAAVADAERLRFRAARRVGIPMAVSLLFPVHYRHPEGAQSPNPSPL